MGKAFHDVVEVDDDLAGVPDEGCDAVLPGSALLDPPGKIPVAFEEA